MLTTAVSEGGHECTCVHASLSFKAGVRWGLAGASLCLHRFLLRRIWFITRGTAWMHALLCHGPGGNWAMLSQWPTLLMMACPDLGLQCFSPAVQACEVQGEWAMNGLCNM